MIVLYWILQASRIANSFYTLYAQEVWDSVHMQDEYRVFTVELIFWKGSLLEEKQQQQNKYGQ